MISFEGLQLVGGHPALDFVNTVEYRGQPQSGDRLGSFAALARWSVTAGLISSAESVAVRSAVTRASSGARALGSALALREALFAVMVARIHGTGCPRGARRVVEQRLEIARAAAILKCDPNKGIYFWRIPIHRPQDVVNRLAERAEELLRTVDTVTVRQCRGPQCDWLFIDRSHGHRRLWCQPAQCGNIVRVRRSRAR